jgi:hypothetical protein
MNTNKIHASTMWLPKLILGFSLYALATSASFAQVTVNCPGDSIGSAVASAAPFTTITINGTCTESFGINNDDVTLQGGIGGGGVIGPGTVPGFTAITIFARGVVIDNLTVSNGAGAGIVVAENGAATIRNSTIENNATFGVVIINSAFARLENNTVRFNGTCDVIAQDAGAAGMSGNTIVSTQANRNICAGLGVFRNASVRMRGGNSVTNNTGTGVAIQTFHGSTLRQDGGHDTVSGNVEVGNESTMEFRDADITGNATALYNSVLRLSNTTVTGDVFVNETNVLHAHSLFGPTTINGTIHCNGGTLFGKSNVTATAIDCPAPIDVVRADGTAKIRAEELDAAVAARSMFELANNGPIGFNMTNTDAALNWRFAAQTTGFRVSLDGTGGPELEVGNGGTLTAGPGGASNLFLDATGNMTIAGTLTQSSDRNAKTAISPLNTPEVLTKLTALPISQWAYKRTPTVKHIGPMAQDFKAAFGLGADDKHLAPGDLAGVAVVGVQALHEMIEVREAQIAEQQTEIVDLKERLAALERIIGRIVAEEPALTASR